MSYEEAKQKFMRDIAEGRSLNWEGLKTVMEGARSNVHALKMRMRGLGISQRSAADLVECSLPAMNQYLNGHLPIPSRIEDTLTKLCQGYEAMREEVEHES